MLIDERLIQLFREAVLCRARLGQIGGLLRYLVAQCDGVLIELHICRVQLIALGAQLRELRRIARRLLLVCGAMSVASPAPYCDAQPVTWSSRSVCAWWLSESSR